MKKIYAAFICTMVAFSLYSKAVAQDTVEAGDFEVVRLTPKKNLMVAQTEVTQKLYENVMGENPSFFKGENFPVENVSWYDAVYFCNKLSERDGLEPVYTVYGKASVSDWKYTPHQGEAISGTVFQKKKANGYRLPSTSEWNAAAGATHKYSGSNKIDEVAWFNENSSYRPHEVAQKKPNGFGLYDMAGNVWEWCWDYFPGNRLLRGGAYNYVDSFCEIGCRYGDSPKHHHLGIGFRLVRSAE